MGVHLLRMEAATKLTQDPGWTKIARLISSPHHQRLHLSLAIDDCLILAIRMGMPRVEGEVMLLHLCVVVTDTAKVVGAVQPEAMVANALPVGKEKLVSDLF